MSKEKIYGYSAEGKPMRTQREVVREWMLRHPGKEHAISHNDCERIFGFKRLSAIIFNLQDEVVVHREKRIKPTRYEGITSNPMFYWIDEEDAEKILSYTHETDTDYTYTTTTTE